MHFLLCKQKNICTFVSANLIIMDISIESYSKEQISMVSLDFKRYMYRQIDWSLRLIGLTGPRGVGKSTLVLQHIKENREKQKSLYVSADHSFFTSHSLIELADEFVKNAGTHLYIDEIHKYENWSRELKQIYDTHPELYIVFTGSSILDIQKGEADLSRRAILYKMQGLSFREYLEFFHNKKVPVYSFEDILAEKVELENLKHPLPLFRHYLQNGYYPFAKEGAFFSRLEQIISQTTEFDIPQFARMSFTTGRKLHRLLKIVSQTVPFKPEYTSLANELKASRNDIPDYLLLLERAEMIAQLRDDTGGMRGLGKTDKIYLDNTNMMYALVENNIDTGTLRETFFNNQVRVVKEVVSSKLSDFFVDEYTFEVGGKNKKRKQIADIPNSFLVKDDIEYMVERTIPLWMFGLMY